MTDNHMFIEVDRKMVDRMNIIWQLKYHAQEDRLCDFARDIGVTETLAKRMLGRGEFWPFTIPIRTDFLSFIGITKWWLLHGDLSNYWEKGHIPFKYLVQPDFPGSVQVFLTNRTPHRCVYAPESFVKEQEAAGTFGEHLERFHVTQGNRQ